MSSPLRRDYDPFLASPKDDTAPAYDAEGSSGVPYSETLSAAAISSAKTLLIPLRITSVAEEPWTSEYSGASPSVVTLKKVLGYVLIHCLKARTFSKYLSLYSAAELRFVCSSAIQLLRVVKGRTKKRRSHGKQR